MGNETRRGMLLWKNNQLWIYVMQIITNFFSLLKKHFLSISSYILCSGQVSSCCPLGYSSCKAVLDPFFFTKECC